MSFLKSNQIATITDSQGDIPEIDDYKGKADVAQSYIYDTNGNLTYDNSKAHTITYNHLNLPSHVHIAADVNLQYIYDAVGNKLRKLITDDNGNPIKSTDYIAGFIYEDTVLVSQQTPEGRLAFGGETQTFTREYYFKDHLGNNRITFAADNETITLVQSVNYYPFGTTFGMYQNRAYTGNNFLYNGKELQNDPNNSNTNLDLLDYGARFYDGVVPHFGQVDPMAEKYYSISPYAYCLGNPIKFVDIQGKDVYIYYVESNWSNCDVISHTAVGVSVNNSRIYYYPSGGQIFTETIQWEDAETMAFGQKTFISETTTIERYNEQGNSVYRLRLKLPDEVERNLMESISSFETDYINNDYIGGFRDETTSPYVSGICCTEETKALLFKSFLAAGYSKEFASAIVEQLIAFGTPEKFNDNEAKKLGITIEHAKFIANDDGCEYTETIYYRSEKEADDFWRKLAEKTLKQIEAIKRN